ncbi:MAG TPA: hypothetical protein VHF22_13575, partial [Planctomycetota bacterium]|nr:hypothetical protein [Planctomycetota bacterium]
MAESFEAPAVAQAAAAGAPGLEIRRRDALVPLLVIFAVTVLAIVVTIVRGKPFVPPEGAPADHAYGPADFPSIYAEDEALKGLVPAPGAEPATGTAALYPVPKPPFSEGMFPCMECHKDLVPSAVRRKLRDPHDEIVLRHDAEHRWCLDCHDAKDRDHLRLASGEL